MTASVAKSQGTELFIVDPRKPPGKILKFSCPTGITGVGTGSKSQIDVTSLDAMEDQEFLGGLGAPGQISVPFNFVPTAESHQGVLAELKAHKGNLKFMVCFSDGKSPPTLAAQGGALTAPANRTSAWFEGYIVDAPLDVATNAQVVGTMTIQRSGALHWTFTPIKHG